MDVFLPSYRLLPEHKFVDSLEDVYRAYIYLVGVRGVKPQDIVLAGLSSGAGLLVRAVFSSCITSLCIPINAL